ncbi:hypothetical protein Rhe02_10690 [Rhizocola hellebori]|uniref:Uncharacterized protein n=1 Tax=Rhizocola hellebori TaxID=1392758 RepID=A0A8J3Q3V6_9ACTN|nr:hypothetical protein [Rhizocola hellebori]GIH03002.1 hypothetical protein Rhe02_10690 [Rhizocola hellebori]
MRIFRRIRNLAILELVNIPLWALVWFGVVGLPATAANLVGFAAFALLLVQGGVYWLLKLAQLRARRRSLAGAEVFRMLRIANVPLLAAALAFTGYAVVAEPGRGSWLGAGLAALAVLEHVNYFHIQLMHDTLADMRRFGTRGLRRSHLARDLAQIT